MKHRSLSRSIALATAGAGAMAGLAACGDSVTANHDWYALPSVTVVTKTVNNVQETGVLLNGSLSRSKLGGSAPGTLVREECVKKGTDPATPFECLLFLNAGQKVYVAAGKTAYPLGNKPYTMTTLTNPAASIVVNVLGATPRTAHVKLSAPLP